MAMKTRINRLYTLFISALLTTSCTIGPTGVLEKSIRSFDKEEGMVTISGIMPKEFTTINFRSSFYTKSKPCLKTSDITKNGYDNYREMWYNYKPKIDSKSQYSISIPTKINSTLCDWHSASIKIIGYHYDNPKQKISSEHPIKIANILFINEKSEKRYHLPLRLTHSIQCRKYITTQDAWYSVSIDCPYFNKKLDIDNDMGYVIFTHENHLKDNLHFKINIHLSNDIQTIDWEKERKEHGF
ncbi:hypothetical protein [Zooshikella sp. RANM57]|uniref:hypothetical protein n=1 Tax=Zooshikella sp. RANM57 TaxID=3425863 RepID=UPI003D6ECC7E